MPHLFGGAGSQFVRDASHLALPKSHQGMSHDAGIQGTAAEHCPNQRWILPVTILQVCGWVSGGLCCPHLSMVKLEEGLTL